MVGREPVYYLTTEQLEDRINYLPCFSTTTKQQLKEAPAPPTLSEAASLPLHGSHLTERPEEPARKERPCYENPRRALAGISGCPVSEKAVVFLKAAHTPDASLCFSVRVKCLFVRINLDYEPRQRDTSGHVCEDDQSQMA